MTEESEVQPFADYENRGGIFFIAKDTIKQDPELVRKILGECIITRAEFMFQSNGIEYVAFSKHFNEQPEGTRAPLYNWQYNEETDELRAVVN